MSEPLRVAVLDDYQGVARELGDWDRLGERVELTVFGDHLADEDAVQARLAPFAAVAAMRERTPFPRSLIERLPNLRLLVTTGMRNASIDVAAARERGVVVCGTRYGGEGTVELTWGLIHALARQIPAEDARVRAGGWQQTVGADLHGRRLGILGLGRIGRKVAAIGQAFGMEVVAWSRNLKAADAAAVGVERVELELLRTAHVITIHLVLSERTTGLIGARELALLRPDALLVNTSRGPIVDEPALVAALQAGALGGAALDVFDVEPLPADHPLRRAPRTVLTPHVGYVTRAAYTAFFTDIVEDVERFLAGAPVREL